MLTYLKWGVRLLVGAALVAFLHYTLPQTDIVRVADTYEKRIDFGANALFWATSGRADGQERINRDVFFIQAFDKHERPIVYRNEDTGWRWPPYFKFSTANLQARATDLKSTGQAPQWAALRHYGWRNELFSIYPNAVGLRPLAGPDVRIIPWWNLVILTGLLALGWTIRSRWRRFVGNWRRPPVLSAPSAQEEADEENEEDEILRLLAAADATRGKTPRRSKLREWLGKRHRP